VEAVDPGPERRILDVAAGTRTSSEPFAPWAHSGALTCHSEFCGRQVALTVFVFVAGDALRLSYADAGFDGVTVWFGLRNVEDVPAAFARATWGDQSGRRARGV